VLAPRAVLQADLAVAARRWPALVAEHLAADFELPADAGHLPEGPLWPAGEFLFVPRGWREPEPIAVGPRPGDELASLLRSLIVIGAGAAVRLVSGCSSPRLSLGPRSVELLDLVVGDGASCRISHIAHGSAFGASWAAVRVRLGRGASVQWTDVDLGAGSVWRSLSADLAGAGAAFKHSALALCGPGRRVTWRADLRSSAPGAQVATRWRALGWCDGQLDGQLTWSAGSSAIGGTYELDGRGLALDPAARIAIALPTPPSTPGSSAFQSFDTQSPAPDALFYARSRGLSRSEALGLLAIGFAAPVLDELPPDFAADVLRIIPLSLAGAAG
jgi:Fe-S cluster assembly protein SufB